MKKKAMFYCQHVLGMGHLIRSAEIVRALEAGGYEVCFLNGGELAEGFTLPDGIEVINLPPIKADAEFRAIHSADGSQDLEAVKASRRELILAAYEQLKPDVLIVELFPFGRRKFAFELVPLLEQIQADGRATKVVCSLRDILVSKRDQTRFDDQVCDAMNRYFDLLLVHADPCFQRLEETFPRLAEINSPVRYTGFVAQRAEAVKADQPRQEGTARILVSIGGGRVGGELLEACVAASALLAESLPHRMQIFTGPYLPDEQFTRLRQLAANQPQINIERFTSEFQSQLEQSDLSISMAGYNTCMNLLAANARALVYPFTGNGNEEQTLRAVKLEKLGAVSIIRDSELEAPVLAEKILQSLRQTIAERPSLDLDGASKTVEVINQLLTQSIACAKGASR
ncbi:MAG: glycosyltransferase [Acidobacteriota bacterium]